MKAFSGACFSILFSSLLGQNGAPINSKVLIINEQESPQLFYLGFQKYELVKDPFSFGKSTLSEVWDTHDLFSSADNSLRPHFVASFFCTILLNELYSETETSKRVAINPATHIGLNLAMAKKDFEIRNAAKVKLLVEKKSKILKPEPALGNTTFYSTSLPSSSSETPKLRTGKIISYLIIFLGFLLVLYGLQNSVLFSNQTVSKQRIIIARRRRWLQKLARYGVINQTTFSLLLKQIKAKDWELRFKRETTRQSELIESGDAIGDLSNRNKGESVVKIRDISLSKTSR